MGKTQALELAQEIALIPSSVLVYAVLIFLLFLSFYPKNSCEAVALFVCVCVHMGECVDLCARGEPIRKMPSKKNAVPAITIWNL